MNKKMIEELKKKAEELNNDEDFGCNKTRYGIYDFKIEDDKYLIDNTEESYYERWLLKDFEVIVEKYGYFLDCECPGRDIRTK